MKKFSLLVFLLATTFAGLTQSLMLTKDDYLQKSKRQKTTGFIFLCGGAALLITGAVVGTSSAADEIASIITEGDDDNSFLAAGVMVATGVAAMAGSIPFFIASGKNKKKAAKISAAIKFDNRKLLQGQKISMRYYPAASLKISL